MAIIGCQPDEPIEEFDCKWLDALCVQDGCHSVCFHPDGNIMVVGMVSARWVVLDVTTRDLITTHSDGNEQIECVTFSPGQSAQLPTSLTNIPFWSLPTEHLVLQYFRSDFCQLSVW